MPELPEVEITRRHLESALEGRRMVSAVITHPRTSRHNASPEEVVRRLEGRKVLSVGRHGKFIVAPLDDGHRLVAHLGMSGRFSIDIPTAPVEPHTHFRAVLDDGAEIRFVDPRTFGFVSVVDEDEIGASSLARLGPDAWTSPPTPSQLADALAGRTAPIKALLLDQGPVSGLGNIYADEALHRAGIHPLTPGGALDRVELGRLVSAIAEVLRQAIDNGGTTLDDLSYLLPDGRAGENMSRLDVYGRTGQPCPVCSTPIERLVIRSRSSHFCPVCQRR
ncbi:MAG: bifunctional DNA-formamidopyrimidine glycosylase/DNA-(apurinic or apyrimidinic site) lyase [Acidimicrobiia bacterium]|nr:bifunctional DNA-formamidopyrimidine glycosylase/DNA-(apurinic or apyrimidinic site) lyase [Acidimicrobiia bacterium]